MTPAVEVRPISVGDYAVTMGISEEHAEVAVMDASEFDAFALLSIATEQSRRRRGNPRSRGSVARLEARL